MNHFVIMVDWKKVTQQNEELGKVFVGHTVLCFKVQIGILAPEYLIQYKLTSELKHRLLSGCLEVS